MIDEEKGIGVAGCNIQGAAPAPLAGDLKLAIRGSVLLRQAALVLFI